MNNHITVCIPSIPSRAPCLYKRALPSVLSQSIPVSNIAIAVDTERVGAWETRNRTLDMASTEWVGFLDDDDELLPHHFQTLLGVALENTADVVWGWFKVIGGTDPFPMNHGKQWDINNPHAFPITCLVRRSLIIESSARFSSDVHNTGEWGVQDLPFWISLYQAGGKFLAIPDVTWHWHHHRTNTSGLGTRW